MYILFDFDGTLVDSALCAERATCQAFASHGYLEPNPDDVRAHMGIPIEKLFPILLGNISYEKEELEQLFVTFRSLYKELEMDTMKVFRGIPEVLKKLKAKGWKIAIVTSKKSDVATRNCEALAITEWIDVIVGSDCVSEYKPNPESVFVALDLLDYADGRIVVVGDSTFDIEMGIEAQTETIGVTWGVHTEDALEMAGATYIVEYPEQIFELLEGVLM
ncbi:MAG: HAD family hydrolase [Bacilli bacterium]